MKRPRVLVIEDNADTRRYIETVLGKDFEVVVAENGSLGLEYARKRQPAVIILDAVMPGLDGYEVCRKLKEDDATKRIPIIFLSSKNTIADIVHGLGLGAEDYMVKPFDYKELIARIRVRLRDVQKQIEEPKTILQGDLRLVMDTREAFFRNAPVDFTQTEFDILRVLVSRPSIVVTREDIILNVWKDDGSGNGTRSRTIDVHIRAIRKKVPTLSKNVISIYGVGYKFVE